MDRREFTTLAGGLAASAVLPTPARADRAHVRYLQSTLTRLRTQDHTVGGGALLPQALRHFAHARRILDESDHTAAIGGELLVVTADLGIESAWFAYDANKQPLARRLYGEAALLADSAGDSRQCVHLYANLVQQCTCLARYTGRTDYAREALRFADRAADAARHESSPALHALISLRQALAHAQTGDDVAFRSAITTARRELDRGPHETDPTWTKFVSYSEITGYEAMAKAQLGTPDHAARLYHAVLDDTARSPRDQAYYRALLAGTLVQAGDPEQAISHGLTVLPDLGTTLASVRVLRELRPVREAAGAAGAAEFCDRFDTVVTFVGHLAAVASPEQMHYVNDQRIALDFAVQCCIIGLLGNVVAVVFLWQHGIWLLVALAPYLLGYLAYRGSIVVAHEYGRALGALVDLNRFELYQRLRLVLPKTTDEERDLTKTLNFLTEQHSRKVGLPYAHPISSVKTSDPEQELDSDE